ncbi:hypothetical protein AX17_003563 [Amanita inopinata Kibby_2008]|nr:hypothetical protein AX17_003563 [Amanita inopinata Kibby_2008]
MYHSIRYVLSRAARSLSTVNSPFNRAVVYTQNGDPSQVLSVVNYPLLRPPPPNTINIRFLLSPINPADINVVEGVYPIRPDPADCLMWSEKAGRPTPVYVGGNEGLAKVTRLGAGVVGLEEGDWVVLSKQQAGTWSSERNVTINDVVKLPAMVSLTEVQAATITVNPPTAYNMLHDFVKLESGDWVVQNGANSSVGQAVIQIAASKGIKTLNFVRDRDDYQTLKKHLLHLGATHVLTYDALVHKSIRDEIKALASGKQIQLGLNCVGGKETTSMAQLLGSNSHLVTYGAMSKQPLSLPASLFIFKNLTAHGFWQSRWYKGRPRSEQEKLLHNLAQLMQQNKVPPILRLPE